MKTAGEGAHGTSESGTAEPNRSNRLARGARGRRDLCVHEAPPVCNIAHWTFYRNAVTLSLVPFLSHGRVDSLAVVALSLVPSCGGCKLHLGKIEGTSIDAHDRRRL